MPNSLVNFSINYKTTHPHKCKPTKCQMKSSEIAKGCMCVWVEVCVRERERERAWWYRWCEGAAGVFSSAINAELLCVRLEPQPPKPPTDRCRFRQTVVPVLHTHSLSSNSNSSNSSIKQLHTDSVKYAYHPLLSQQPCCVQPLDTNTSNTQ